ncbi:hypothetical protein ABIB06_001453 [Bradyrhizobium sp. LB8.2]
MQIAPLPVARDFWVTSPVHSPSSTAVLSAAVPSRTGEEASPL